ncbi:uncharacterized protein BXZ73DRAFT_103291 [Epithele typhae]|uniref:uncharacterized protein n=1 Tax=Epithele typhae TaxID=378194 RepID=UPI0020078E37|nr:uncharacterized protein BXZ73DRAFT_103291 [Epithele typhae]KAH9925411.1 hypothetical protein BXZ73DRAFT_103291 [Epithele typhae]
MFAPTLTLLVLALSTLTAPAAAQSVTIAAPAPNATLPRGSSFVVDVDRPCASSSIFFPATLTGSQDVAVAIGLLGCPNGVCAGLNASVSIGRTLFSGPYAPTPVGHGRADLAQNFTVQVPDNFSPGPALLSVAHFGLIIASGSEPFLEVVSEEVVIGQ